MMNLKLAVKCFNIHITLLITYTFLELEMSFTLPIAKENFIKVTLTPQVQSSELTLLISRL